MLNDDTRNKIQDIISGTPIHWQTDYCTAVRNHLCRSYSPGTTVKTEFESQFLIKEEQAQLLNNYIEEHVLWLQKPPDKGRLLTIGGEAEVYINIEEQQVIKINDAVYYATWLDFFTSLLIHNLLFAETGYQLIGFTRRNNELQAILQQPFIVSDAPVDLNDVKIAPEYNGFKNTRRNDYYSDELGLILEDIHDENVIVNSEFLFFIDTVFYVNLKAGNQSQI